MKKQTILKSLLILLPILAVGLATTRDSVLVFDTVSGITEYYSYFDMIPTENLQAVPATAAMLSLVSGVLGAMYILKKREWCLTGILVAALGSSCAAVVPTVQQGVVRVVPNVGLPIFMLINCLVAYHFLKHPEKKEEKKIQRKLKR